MIPIAEDYAAISAGLKQIAPDNEPTVCPTCESTGWIIKLHMFSPYFQVCDQCGNPEMLPEP
jgi:hypothetical protein